MFSPSLSGEAKKGLKNISVSIIETIEPLDPVSSVSTVVKEHYYSIQSAAVEDAHR